MCLRSVHSLLSLRFGGGSSYLTAIHPSLHCVQFISPTSAPHGLGKYSFPFRKLHSFRFPQDLFQRISNGLFFILRRVHPKRNKAPFRQSGKFITPNRWVFRRSASIRTTIRPHHPLVVQKINIFRVLLPCACGKYFPFQLHFVPGSAVVPPLTLHLILPTFQAYTSVPHSLGKYSFPFRKLIHSVFPKPFSNAFPAVYIYFCDEFTPMKIKPLSGERKKEMFNLDYNWRLSRE